MEAEAVMAAEVGVVTAAHAVRIISLMKVDGTRAFQYLRAV